MPVPIQQRLLGLGSTTTDGQHVDSAREDIPTLSHGFLVMAAGEAVVVGVRVRPFNDREQNLDAVLCIDMEGPTTRIRNIDTGDEKTFTFDESFWSHDGFEDDGTGYLRPVPGSLTPLAKEFLTTHGMAGKSYSMVGYGYNKGIVPISCEEIFSRIGNEKDPEKRYEVTVSMIEIYNEAIQDLLIDVGLRPKKGLEVRESKALGIYIDGVIKRPVENYEAIETTIEEATNHRTVGSTLMNATSSRAHTVQLIEFKAVTNGSATVSMINLVDLAGSEKAAQTALWEMIEKLADRGSEKKKNVLIPYRDSKLTRLLQNALGGSSKTIMICALSPASSNHEETLSTLRYADRAKKIKNVAVPNENPQERLMRELREENEKLRKMFEAMQGGVMPDADSIKEMGLAQQEIAAMEGALAEFNKSWEEKVAESREQQEAARLRRSSITPGFSSLQPMMVNLNEDKTLAGRVRFVFSPGRNLIGGLGDESDSDSSSSESEKSEDQSSSSSDSDSSKSKEAQTIEEDEQPTILLGEGVARHHAVVFNEMDLCSIYAASEEGLQSTFVNGKSLKQLFRAQGIEEKKGICRQVEKPKITGIELSHADTLVFGRHFFVFVDHTVCAPEILIASGQVDYAQAKREWQMEQLTGVHESLIVATRGGVLGVSHVAELAEKDEIIEEQKAEISELKQQLAATKAELDRYKKMAGGRLAAGANLLGEMYADDLLEGEMDKISFSIRKTFTEAIEQMNDVQAIFTKKAMLRDWKEGALPESEPLPRSILRDQAEQGVSSRRTHARISFADSTQS
eukprot:s69_g29.t2